MKHLFTRSFVLGCGLLLSTACQSAPRQAPTRDALLLVATRGDERVTALSTTELQPEWSVELGLGAHELAISDDGCLGVGSAYGGPGPMHQPADNRLAVFDLEERKLVSTIDLGEHQRPNDLAFLPDGQHVLVTSEVRGALLLVDLEENQIERVIDLKDPTGHMLAYAPSAPGELGRAFVSHVMSGRVSVIDVAAGSVLERVPAALGAEGIACTPDGSRVWCANNRSHSITVFDGHSLEVLHTLECPGFPFRTKVSSNGARAVVSCPMKQEVIVFDATTADELVRFDLSDRGRNVSPQGVGISPDGKQVVVACAGLGEVLLLDVDQSSVVATYEAGPMLDPVAFD